MRDEKKRKRIAFLGGGIQNIPSYVRLLELLSDHYDIRLYSEFFIDSQKNGTRYKIKSTPSIKLPGRLRLLWFGAGIFFDQLFWRADIFHAHSTFPSGLTAIFLGKLFRKPVLVAVNAGEGIEVKSIGFGDLLNRRRTKINQFVLTNAHAITAVSHYHKSLLVRNLSLKTEVKVIPRGVDVSQFQFDRRTISFPIRFLNIAYIHPVKGQEMLLKSFSILSRKFDCTLVQVGRDLMNGQLQKMCREMNLGDRAQFLGSIRHEEISRFYKNADVLLHTSHHEAQPVVVSEALASGILVCGTMVGLIADLDGQCTVAVDPGDHEGLAKKIEQLLSSPEQMNTLRANGKKWTEEHDIHWTKKEYKSIYDSLLCR